MILGSNFFLNFPLFFYMVVVSVLRYYKVCWIAFYYILLLNNTILDIYIISIKYVNCLTMTTGIQKR